MRPLRIVFDNGASAGFGKQPSQIFEGGSSWRLGGLFGVRCGIGGRTRGSLREGESTEGSQSEEYQQRTYDAHRALLN